MRVLTSSSLRSNVGFIEIDVLPGKIENIKYLGLLIFELMSIHLLILFFLITILPFWCCFHNINIYIFC
jgi:hypothetical protein